MDTAWGVDSPGTAGMRPEHSGNRTTKRRKLPLYAYERGETEGGIMLDKYMAICEVIGADPVMLLSEAMAGNPEDK